MGKERKQRYFQLSDYVVLHARYMGIASKVIIMPWHNNPGPLFIPGGVVAGGVYMLFLILGTAITGKLGAALGSSDPGSTGYNYRNLRLPYGAASLITYTLPGLAVELGFSSAGTEAAALLFCGRHDSQHGGNIRVNLAF